MRNGTYHEEHEVACVSEHGVRHGAKGCGLRGQERRRTTGGGSTYLLRKSRSERWRWSGLAPGTDQRLSEQRASAPIRASSRRRWSLTYHADDASHQDAEDGEHAQQGHSVERPWEAGHERGRREDAGVQHRAELAVAQGSKGRLTRDELAARPEDGERDGAEGEELSARPGLGGQS